MLVTFGYLENCKFIRLGGSFTCSGSVKSFEFRVCTISQVNLEFAQFHKTATMHSDKITSQETYMQRLGEYFVWLLKFEPVIRSSLSYEAFSKTFWMPDVVTFKGLLWWRRSKIPSWHRIYLRAFCYYSTIRVSEGHHYEITVIIHYYIWCVSVNIIISNKLSTTPILDLRSFGIVSWYCTFSLCHLPTACIDLTTSTPDPYIDLTRSHGVLDDSPVVVSRPCLLLTVNNIACLFILFTCCWIGIRLTLSL